MTRVLIMVSVLLGACGARDGKPARNEALRRTLGEDGAAGAWLVAQCPLMANVTVCPV